MVAGYILRKHKARKKMNKYSKTTIRTARRTKGSIPGDNVQTFLVKLLLLKLNAFRCAVIIILVEAFVTTKLL